MKTKNNIQKTVLKTFAVIISFVLISFTVSAQEFWHSIIENDTTKEMVLAIIDNNNESKAAESARLISTVIYSETESDSSMEVEEWMTTEKTFRVQEKPEQKTENETSKIIFVEIEDAELDLEDWMFNTSYWESRN